MKILAVYPRLAYPVRSGIDMRTESILRALTERHEVTYLCLSNDVEGARAVQDWDLTSRFSGRPMIVPNHRVRETGRVADRVYHWGELSPVRGFDYPELREALRGLTLDTFDAVHCGSPRLAPYVLGIKRTHPGIRTVLDLPDVESGLQWRLAQTSVLPLASRDRLRNYADSLRAYFYEAFLLRSFDSVWVCSERERQKLSLRDRRDAVQVVPNVVDTSRYRPSASSSDGKPRFLYVGIMDWEPNIDAVLHFCKSIWPLIRERLPEAEFWIVGSNPAEDVLRLQSDRNSVFVTGEVESVIPYLQKSSALVVPLLSGGGTRMKILEAMAAGLPVVSTAVGAEGLGATHNENILIADESAEFASSCIEAVLTPGLRGRLIASARDFVTSNYDYAAVRGPVQTCYESFQREPDAFMQTRTALGENS